MGTELNVMAMVGASRTEGLIVEGSELVPSADFDRPRQVTILIVLIAALRNQKRRRIESEVESVIVADLRIAGAVSAGGIAIVHAEHEAPSVIRLECDAHAGRCERIGWARHPVD